MHVARACPHAVTADVGVMDARADKADNLLPIEDRRENRNVEEVRRREPRIVGDEVVARLERLRRERLDEMLASRPHRVDVAGRTGDSVRDEAAALI